MDIQKEREDRGNEGFTDEGREREEREIGREVSALEIDDEGELVKKKIIIIK